MVCTFFGHRDCYGLEKTALSNTIERLIEGGVDTFYIGNQGSFDAMAFSCLMELKKVHTHISILVVLAYYPISKNEDSTYNNYSIYPEEVAKASRKFAIDKRNYWMLKRADCCLCYVNHTWGGAYKFALRAKRCGITVINLGCVIL